MIVTVHLHFVCKLIWIPHIYLYLQMSLVISVVYFALKRLPMYKSIRTFVECMWWSFCPQLVLTEVRRTYSCFTQPSFGYQKSRSANIDIFNMYIYIYVCVRACIYFYSTAIGECKQKIANFLGIYSKQNLVWTDIKAICKSLMNCLTFEILSDVYIHIYNRNICIDKKRKNIR